MTRTRDLREPDDIERRKPYARNIIRARIAKQWSGGDLAEALGKDRAVVVKWERGRQRPSAENAELLADVLGGSARSYRDVGEQDAESAEVIRLREELAAVVARVEALERQRPDEQQDGPPTP